MRFSIGLGRTGSATQWYLPGTDIARLPSPPDSAPAPVPGALEESVTSIGGSGALLNGLVGVVGSPDAGSGLVLDVLGAWNSVKNGSFLSDEAGNVTLSGFVHADVVLGDGGDSSVLLHGAKRGNVLTGGGDDTVTIEAASNVHAWVNEFRVATGRGDDTVVVRALDTAAAAASDATFAATTSGAGAFTGSVLRLLVAASGQPVNRDAISREAFRRPWQPEDRAVDGLVKRLRRKLGPDAIQTSRGLGYALAIEVHSR